MEQKYKFKSIQNTKMELMKIMKLNLCEHEKLLSRKKEMHLNICQQEYIVNLLRLMMMKLNPINSIYLI